MGLIISFFHFLFHLNEQLTVLVLHYGLWIYALLFLIIFCETGLVVTAIMPGDSLLFAAGAVAASGALNIYLLFILLVIAAFLGNVANYWVGNKLGHLLFQRDDALFLKKSYLAKTHGFFEKYGAKTIVIARFVPIVRTFAPFVAGMGAMNQFVFMLYNFIGAFFWVALLLCVSYLFGNIPIVKNNFSFVILAIIILSVLPPIVELVKLRIQRAE